MSVMPMRGAIRKLAGRENLTQKEAMEAMGCIMEGCATEAQIGSFITALRLKGETIEEITGCARAMREKAERIAPRVNYLIDTCGTGGDNSNTFNISTAVAIIAAAGGMAVAKHGNRSVSSRSGSADVLEALGVNIALEPDRIEDCIEKIGIGFMFAPKFHKSMKYAAGPRKELGIRTIFNMLGPLTNPANAQGQVLGVFDGGLTESVANVLLNLGIERALVIHGMDGLDEITISGATKVSEVRDGSVSSYEIHPGTFGLRTASVSELASDDAAGSARIIESVLEGKEGPCRDVVLMNSAAAFYIGKAVERLEDGFEMAAHIIDSGRAKAKLEELKKFTQSAAGK